MAITNNLLHTTKNIKLSIQVSLNGLSFCILNANTNTITQLKNKELKGISSPFDLLEAIKSLFETEKELQDTFSFVQIIHVNQLSTVIPKNIYESNSKADYLKFGIKILKSDYVIHDVIKSNNSVTVYVPYVTINNFIFDKFGSYNYKHYSTILIESILKIEKDTITTKCYVHIENNHFEIIVVNQKGLVFYNTFKYNSLEDYIYYLLFTFEQLRLDTETTKVILLGIITKEDLLYAITYKYIRNVEFGNISYNYNFNEKPLFSHTHFTLLHSLCE